jgi:predicted Zn-dependent protease with MMP-like domain
MQTDFTYPPSLDDIAEIAEAALAEIPAAFRRHVKGVALRVDEFPDDETLDALDLESPFDLLGLYRGTDIGHKSSGVAHDVDMIFLYRSPILDEWIAGGEPLKDLIRNVLIHEIGHHLGLSDEDMERIEGAAVD